MKFLLWALVIYLVWRWFSASKKIAAGEEGEPLVPDPRSTDTATPAVVSEKMVQCTQCGLHLPQSEAVTDGSAAYCSQAHLLLHRSP